MTRNTKTAQPDEVVTERVLTREDIHDMTLATAVDEVDLPHWRRAARQSEAHSDRSLFGRAQVLLHVIDHARAGSGWVASDYVREEGAAAAKEGLRITVSDSTVSQLSLLVLAIRRGIHPDAVAETDKRRWDDIVRLRAATGAASRIRKVLKDKDSTRADLDAAISPPVVLPDAQDDSVDAGSDEVEEIDTATGERDTTYDVAGAFIRAASDVVAAALTDEQVADVRAAAASVLARCDAVADEAAAV